MNSHSSEVVFGFHAVLTLLRRTGDSPISRLLVLQGRQDQRMHEILILAQQRGIEIKRVGRQELDILTQGARHQGVVAEGVASATTTEVDLASLLSGNHPQLLLLVLDGVQDPHNLGACLRSAEAAGVTAVIAPKDRAVGINPTVRKVACGAAEVIPFIQVTNLARALREMHDSGVWIVGTAGEGSRSLYETELTGRLAIVMGAEGEGMRRLTAEHCDALIHIPMAGVVESLNVSVATGVCLFEAVRQRRSKDKGSQLPV